MAKQSREPINAAVRIQRYINEEYRWAADRCHECGGDGEVYDTSIGGMDDVLCICGMCDGSGKGAKELALEAVEHLLRALLDRDERLEAVQEIVGPIASMQSPPVVLAEAVVRDFAVKIATAAGGKKRCRR